MIKQNIQATKDLFLRSRMLTPRQWQKARAVLDMTRSEIMEDETMLFVVMAWHKEGCKDLDVYLDKTEDELQELLGYDLSEANAEMEKALAALDEDDNDDETGTSK